MDKKSDQVWSPNEIVEQTSAKHRPLVQWWYNQTAIPDPSASASFATREAARKSHLLSTIIFWLIFSFLLFIPGCFVVSNHYIIYADLGMLVFCIVAIFGNRAQKPLLAGVLLTIGFELALTAVIFTTRPYDEPSIQQYELFVFGELLCVSLLAPNSVFLVMIYNIGIIITSLFLPLALQPRTQSFILDLQAQWAPILIRPVAVQILVACVCWLWVRSANQAIKRADRAEMIARLEHQLAEQKLELELGMQQILKTHVEIANGNLTARAPLNQDNVLWQITVALNNLLVRLQRASIAEQKLQRVEKAVSGTVQAIQITVQRRQNPRLSLTQTEIDPLIAALQGKTIEASTLPPLSSQLSDNQPFNEKPHSPYFR